MVGIIMLVLRKPIEKPTELPATPTLAEPVNPPEEFLTPAEQTAQAFEDQEQEEPKSAPKKAVTKKEKRAAIKAEKLAQKNDKPTQTQAPRELEKRDVTPTSQPVPTPTPPVHGATATQTITLNPSITSKNLSVKHGFFSYSPTSISLSVNDEEIEVNDDDPITLKVDADNTITTHCKYKFIAGYHGEHTSKWKVKPGEEYTVSFSWKTPQKIEIEGAELLSSFKGSEADAEEEYSAESEEAESATTQEAKNNA
jgi:hypothetical protein